MDSIDILIIVNYLIDYARIDYPHAELMTRHFLALIS